MKIQFFLYTLQLPKNKAPSIIINLLLSQLNLLNLMTILLIQITSCFINQILNIIIILHNLVFQPYDFWFYTLLKLISDQVFYLCNLLIDDFIPFRVILPLLPIVFDKVSDHIFVESAFVVYLDGFFV